MVRVKVRVRVSLLSKHISAPPLGLAQPILEGFQGCGVVLEPPLK